jgi:protein tyrosine/serine phosphatase
MTASAPASPDGRALVVSGLVNIRDLGGLAAGDRSVRPGRLLRSDSLGGLTDAGVDMLLEQVGVRLVVDLRTPEECRREGIGPLASHGVGYRNIPLEPQSALNEADVAAGKATNLLDDYLAHLAVSGAELIEGFELVADPGNAPTLVHCTAGKDRTGIFIGLLLDLLGVARDEVVDDYAATAANMLPVLERIRSSPFFQSNGLASAPAWIFEAEAETMRSFLRTVDERYGGVAAWTRQMGARPGLVDDLRASLLQGPAAA